MSVSKLFIPREFAREGYSGHAISEDRPPTRSAARDGNSGSTEGSKTNRTQTDRDAAVTAYRFQSLIRGTGTA